VCCLSNEIKMWRLPRGGEEDLRKNRFFMRHVFWEANHIFSYLLEAFLFFLVYDVDEMNVRGITLCLSLN
jgi:hypothetical protein